MKLGLSDQDYEYLQNEVIIPLKRAGINVFCFGSRARGDFQPFSDIDLMLENKTTQKQEKLVSEIKEKLSKSNFPYKVDIVDLNQFATSYLDSYHKEKVQLSAD